MLCLRRHVGQKLKDIWAHCVVGEMVFNTPNRLEPERLRLESKVEIALIDGLIGNRFPWILEDDGHPNMHDIPPCINLRILFESAAPTALSPLCLIAQPSLTVGAVLYD